MRISRVQQQARTRRAVLEAARSEFAERGYTEAKIDRIAERADLTRGAVYSNFASKRALYLAVLLDAPGRDTPPPGSNALPLGNDELRSGREPAPPGRGALPPDNDALLSGRDSPERGTLPPGNDAPSPGRHTALPANDALRSGRDTLPSGNEPRSPGRDASLFQRADASDPSGRDAAGEPAALTVPGAVEAFARTWLERLPLAYGDATAGRLQARSLTGVFDDDERGRIVLAQITRLESLLLAVALESCRARDAGRRVRLAELILTMLHGAAGLAETAPGFGDAFDVARACRHLAGLDLTDEWDPPYLPYVQPARLVRETWIPPGEVFDELSGRPFTVGDGMIVALGPGRIGGAEDAVRAARPGEIVTIAAVVDDPAETGPLVRLRLTDLTANLRRIFGPAYRPSLRLVLDDTGALASATGVTPAFDTEVSIRVSAGAVVTRADGPGAAYATATARDAP